MQLMLEKYSYHSGEEILNNKAAIRNEVESILLQPSTDILTLSGDEYAQIVRNGFLQRGWENEPSLVVERELVSLMDFRKERVGIRLGLETSSSPDDMIGFHSALKSPETEIDVGIYTTVTTELQQHLTKSSGKAWAGPDFDMATKELRQIAQSILVPVCILGIGLRKAPLLGIDLSMTPSSEIKRLFLSFLESEYGAPVIKNVCIAGKSGVLEFDGITRLEGRDIVLASEISSVIGVYFPSWIEPDRVSGLIKQVREYREISGRNACLRFVLLGNYDTLFIQQAFGSNGIVTKLAQGLAIEYEMRRFEEFEKYLLANREPPTSNQ